MFIFITKLAVVEVAIAVAAVVAATAVPAVVAETAVKSVVVVVDAVDTADIDTAGNSTADYALAAVANLDEVAVDMVAHVVVVALAVDDVDAEHVVSPGLGVRA